MIEGSGPDLDPGGQKTYGSRPATLLNGILSFPEGPCWFCGVLLPDSTIFERVRMFCMVLVKEDMRRALTSLPQVLAESAAKKIQVKVLALWNTLYIYFDNFKNCEFWDDVPYLLPVVANGIYIISVFYSRQCLCWEECTALFDADPTVYLVRVSIPCFKKLLT